MSNKKILYHGSLYCIEQPQLGLVSIPREIEHRHRAN